MSSFIVGFICAVLLAIVLIILLAYCMFCKERHKSESYQYQINDLRQRNIEIAQDQGQEVKNEIKQFTAGVFILPSRHKHDEDYIKRPDYPESSAPNLQPNMEKLIDILDDSAVDVHRGVSFDRNSDRYYSEV